MKLGSNLNLELFQSLWADRFVPWWYRWYRRIFFLYFLVVLGFGGSLWYHYLYRYQWSPEEKQAYQETSFHKTDFKVEKFERIIEVLKKREVAHLEGYTPERNLFE